MTLRASQDDREVAFDLEGKFLEFLRSIHPAWNHSRERILREGKGNPNLKEAQRGDYENLEQNQRIEFQCAPGNTNRGEMCGWTQLKYHQSTATPQVFAFPKLKKVFAIDTALLRRWLGPEDRIDWQDEGDGKFVTRIAYFMFERWGATALTWSRVFER